MPGGTWTVNLAKIWLASLKNMGRTTFKTTQSVIPKEIAMTGKWHPMTVKQRDLSGQLTLVRQVKAIRLAL